MFEEALAYVKEKESQKEYNLENIHEECIHFKEQLNCAYLDAKSNAISEIIEYQSQKTQKVMMEMFDNLTKTIFHDKLLKNNS